MAENGDEQNNSIPPLDNLDLEEENDDLFGDAIDTGANGNTLDAGAGDMGLADEEIGLGSEEETSPQKNDFMEPDPEPEPEPEPKKDPLPSASIQAVQQPAVSKAKDEIEEEETDKFQLEIIITDPQKIGDGMSAYMAYRVTTRTTLPMFRKSEFSVMRRFSDFLGIHDKLAAKHVPRGYIIPAAPEKSVIGMTKVKMTKEEGAMEFVEKRRAALERYLNRTATHPLLRQDPDFRDFLEKDELPRATSTSALSGAGMMRLFNKAADTVSKAVVKMNESDQWFEDKQHHIENLENQVRKLHSSMETLVSHRKDLSTVSGSFAKSVAMLGNSEENTALSRALAQLAEVEERIEQVHHDQANTDFYLISELLKDYLGLIHAVKEAFREREKTYLSWQNAQSTLGKKRELETKLKVSGKPDKLAQVQQEIEDWESRVENGEKDFENVSKTIRKELLRFEETRVQDFKSVIVKYLEYVMNAQQEVMKHWEGFLPEAKAIL